MNLLHVPQRLYLPRSNLLLADSVAVADFAAARMRGLLGRDIPTGQALLLTPCKQVHTIGMGHALDVIFCDDRLRVVKVVRALRPNRISPIVRRARCALELLPGPARGVQEGDQLELR